MATLTRPTSISASSDVSGETLRVAGWEVGAKDAVAGRTAEVAVGVEFEADSGYPLALVLRVRLDPYEPENPGLGIPVATSVDIDE